MQRQVLVALGRQAPVHSPLEHREALVPWKWGEGCLAVEGEQYLRPQPQAPQAGRAIDADDEIDEGLLILDDIVCVLDADALGHRVKARTDPGDKRARAQPQRRMAQPSGQFAVRQVGDFHSAQARTKPRDSSWANAAPSAEISASDGAVSSPKAPANSSERLKPGAGECNNSPKTAPQAALSRWQLPVAPSRTTHSSPQSRQITRQSKPAASTPAPPLDSAVAK